jgi:molecular chaperone IbpA
MFNNKMYTDFWNVLEHEDFPFITLTSTTNGQRQFPPYNIIESKDGNVRLEMAIAGYNKDQIRVEKEGSTLIIQGSSLPSGLCKTNDSIINRDGDKEIFRHKGISSTAFVRTFDLKPGAEIGDVQLKDGILTVIVFAPKPVQPPRTTFEIK